MADQRICSIPDCDKPARYNEWCDGHYARWRRHGDPLIGRVSHGTPLRFYESVVCTYDGQDCLTWPYARDSAGYGQVWKDGRVQYVSRLICEATNGPPPTPGHMAAHTCGKGHEACCAKTHLVWKTPAANSADMVGHNTLLRGVAASWSKLTEADVLAIRQRAASGETQQTIANSFEVSRSLVGAIVQRKRWSHI